MSLVELSGKVALVTGAGRRIGRCIALALAREGARLAVHYNRSKEQAEATAAEIRAGGGEAMTVRAELVELSQVRAMFAAVEDRFGRLDVLVNNASAFYPTPLEEMTEPQWDRLLAVNAKAPAFAIQSAARLMCEGGAIVNLTDISAARPWAGFVAYCAGKAALAAVTISAAKALAARGIRVNAVAPGVIEPPAGASPETLAKLLKRVPLGRKGDAEDVASAVLFLIHNDYVTGVTLNVDGGKSIIA